MCKQQVSIAMGGGQINYALHLMFIFKDDNNISAPQVQQTVA